MDFNLKQWRDESEEEEHQTPSAKLPRIQHHPPALPLFVPDPNTTLSAYSPDPAAKFPRIGSYFSLSQWQELELQALIFRHMIAGAAVPPELLHLVKKSLINSSSSSSSSQYYLSHSLHQCYPYQPAYEGCHGSRAGQMPEDGWKKWRCSRVVAGQKYCERHMHRPKPFKKACGNPHIHHSAYGGDAGGETTLKSNHSITGQGISTGAGDRPHFTLSVPSQTTGLLHLNQRPSDFTETKAPFEAHHNGQHSGQMLRRFIDDWPKPLDETETAANSVASATNLSISMPGNPSSDFSLKLGTGNGDEASAQVLSGERVKPQLNWSTAWGTNPTAPMGGPLAEALRSSIPNSSPTSVLHRLPRGLTSEASYVNS
ncbi:UNVERIFIED_CONTAM: Growth-regulating factor 3 [Sesamum calycinum]|uniref:Growth-regulating factor n=1 Tax=Sesamum calycinum TaxID=2727403 RepID=A0AAW2MZS0_9LAMI